MAIYSLVYGIYLDKSWKNNSPITTYQFNNHNSSQTIQQPSATGNNSRNLNHLFNSFGKDVEGMGHGGSGLYLHSCLKIIMAE